MKKWIFFFVFIAVPCLAVDGPLNVEHPAEVTGVATPDEIIGVTDLAAAGGGISWTFICAFEGSDGGGTTYTAGGTDTGFSSGTLSTSNMVDETNDSITLDADDEKMAVTRTDSIFQSDQGAYEIEFTWTNSTSSNSDLMYFGVNTTNMIRLEILGATGRPKVTHRGQGSANVAIDTSAVTSGQKARIRIKYYATGNNTTDVLSIAVDDNADGTYASWFDTTDTDAVTQFSSEPTNWEIGDGLSGTIAESFEVFYIKWVHDYTAFD